MSSITSLEPGKIPTVVKAHGPDKKFPSCICTVMMLGIRAAPPPPSREVNSSSGIEKAFVLDFNGTRAGSNEQCLDFLDN